MPYRTVYRLNVRDRGFEYVWATAAPGNRQVEELVDWCLSQDSRRRAPMVFLPVSRERLVVFARTEPADVGDQFGRRLPAAIVGCVIDNPSADAAGVVKATLKCARWHDFVARAPDLFESFATDPLSAAATGRQLIAKLDSQLDAVVDADLVFLRESSQKDALAELRPPHASAQPAREFRNTLERDATPPRNSGGRIVAVAWLALILAMAACAGVWVLFSR